MDPRTTIRFQSKIRKSDECWLWTAAQDKDGYGRFRLGDNVVFAHRVAYEAQNGSVSDDICVLHNCDNPPCVNPEHLFVGTKADNNHDKRVKGRGRGGVSLGEAHGNAKLTNTKVRKIRAECAAGSTQLCLAEKYSVSKNAISQIVNRRAWQHLKG